MSKFIPSIITVDNIQATRMITINGNKYIARTSNLPYYGNFIKRFIAACYILAGKGMVVRYTEDLYKNKG